MKHAVKHNILGVNISAITLHGASDAIIRAAHEQRRLGVSALAVHGVMTGALDRIHRTRLNALDMLVPDGQPVRWALNRLHGANLNERVYGPDLMLHVCDRAADDGLGIYLYGSSSAVLEPLQQQLRERFPGLQIAGVQPSRFRTLSAAEKQADIERIQHSGARIVFVGLGCPRQEVWVYEHLQHLSLPLVAVGAAFDFHAGRVTQAPVWMQRRGLEWLYRFSKEPGRLWKRYMLLNPLYMVLVALQWGGVYRLGDAVSMRLDAEIRYG